MNGRALATGVAGGDDEVVVELDGLVLELPTQLVDRQVGPEWGRRDGSQVDVGHRTAGVGGAGGPADVGTHSQSGAQGSSPPG